SQEKYNQVLDQEVSGGENKGKTRRQILEEAGGNIDAIINNPDLQPVSESVFGQQMSDEQYHQLIDSFDNEVISQDRKSKLKAAGKASGIALLILLGIPAAIVAGGAVVAVATAAQAGKGVKAA